ncbi:ABC transporter substrate-binding protein [Gellertiella hungarica]|uniref:ABC-type branched-subunit amino acid transport system substrate-binding protein n=1 Tax=Gellertiella hungarica TaxID=1572859 RepID=A0A7W6J160_9HYPH|nr:ABC transporter substrate-binding protein [Gellertiella hungarica]MBB4062869.1 ABC-type branched-subunit amino acid transport system substrate-binding protein [Gellertiella hungarica]
MPSKNRASGKRGAVLIGALAPLSRPGWVEAGQQMLAGMQQAVSDINAAGGLGGQELLLVVRDTAADPATAEAAVDALAGQGVTAIAGEYHSVVARVIAARAEALGIPFVCSSAVIDGLLEKPGRWVARIAPPQSKGWSRYAAHLLAAGHRHIAAACQPSVYWQAGIRILRASHEAAGGSVAVLDLQSTEPAELCDRLAAGNATALLLLAGHPEPALSLAEAVLRDTRLSRLKLGAPAGQPEFPGWVERLGAGAAGIPFLRYLPPATAGKGVAIAARLSARLGGTPSFVALEGYDAMLVLADALRQAGLDRARVPLCWPKVQIEGSRGDIVLSRADEDTVWQWASAPVEIAERDPADPERFRTVFR